MYICLSHVFISHFINLNKVIFITAGVFVNAKFSI